MEFKSDFLNEAFERGFIYQCTDFSLLDKKLSSEICIAYAGFDATAKSLHVGHLIPIFLLRMFQKYGHKPIALIGGGTTKIGDPTFRNSMRPILSDEQLMENLSGLKRCLSKFLKFDDTSKIGAHLVNNADWLNKLQYLPFLREIGVHFSINRMITFDSVKTRLDSNNSITFTEFNYMLMQAYDFLELHKMNGVNIQFGGQDQWGNIVCGAELVKKVTGHEVIGCTSPLLTKSDGQKMGKSANGAIWLSEEAISPYDFWQYWRNVPDEVVGKCLRLFTDLKIDEIKKLELLKEQEINEAKKILADEVTKITHGNDALESVKKSVDKLFGNKDIASENVPSIIVNLNSIDDFSIIDALIEMGVANSKGEAKRLLRGKAVTIDGNYIDESYKPENVKSNDERKIVVGKKKMFIIRFRSPSPQ